MRGAQILFLLLVCVTVITVMFWRFRRGRVGLRLGRVISSFISPPHVPRPRARPDDASTSTTEEEEGLVAGEEREAGHIPSSARGGAREPYACCAPWSFWRRGHAGRRGTYAPVWIYVDRPTRDGQCEIDLRTFETAFHGYERLALLIAYTRLAQTNNLLFVHRGNWHTYLPNLPADFETRALDPRLRHDYIKYHLLANYGGLWITPRTVVLGDLNGVLAAHEARRARRDLAIVAGDRPATSAYHTALVPDDRVVLCHPRNRVLLRIAEHLQLMVARAPSYSSYAFEDYAGKQLLRYSSRVAYGTLADSVVRLGNDAAGSVDACRRRVTPEILLSAHPHDCPPRRAMLWLSLDARDLERQRNYAWFTRLAEEQIVHSGLWVAHVYQQALGQALPSGAGASSEEEPGTDAAAAGRRSTTIAVRADLNPLRAKWEASWREGAAHTGAPRMKCRV